MSMALWGGRSGLLFIYLCIFLSGLLSLVFKVKVYGKHFGIFQVQLRRLKHDGTEAVFRGTLYVPLRLSICPLPGTLWWRPGHSCLRATHKPPAHKAVCPWITEHKSSLLRGPDSVFQKYSCSPDPYAQEPMEDWAAPANYVRPPPWISAANGPL